MNCCVKLTGTAGSGKDTVADFLVSEFGFTKIAFADPLREFMVAQNADVRMDGSPEWWPVSAIIEKYGWQGYKQSPFAGNLRKLIQRTGTEAGRGVIRDSLWIDTVMERAAQVEGPVVFSDARFPNEANCAPGPIVRVIRNNAIGAGDHSSESEMRKIIPDFVINNNRTIGELKIRTSEMISWASEKNAWRS